ncbi:MAG: 50S ribosomal protein L3 N(5)-glutamine methyltransferase [Bauldia sp.]|nr:50S ribosomal protein L3 N(5)-glutamine methyltransferase [Bauldia sp.]
MTAAHETDGFVTVRDFFRWAVSRFNAADLAYGHGTDNALDEAAFIVLETLRLPVDRLDPFLDARLTPAERARLASIVDARVATRKPAPYLVGAAYIQGVRFRSDERALIPRSFIGEMLSDGSLGPDAAGLIPDFDAVGSALDIGTGSGCLAILAARLFPNAKVDAVDISAPALELAALNVDDHRLGDRISLFRGDLFEPLGKRRYDVIIANPPYVDAVAMGELPAEFRHEPANALAAGTDGLDVVRRILADAWNHLTPEGGLLCEVGRDGPALEAAYPEVEFLWLDSEASSGEVFWLSADALRPLAAAGGGSRRQAGKRSA